MELTHDSVRIYNEQGAPVDRPVRLSSVSGAMIGKDGHRHFMLKEIHEQPLVIGQTLNSFIDPGTDRVVLPALPFDLGRIPRVTVVACGTAYYAGMVAKYWFEQIAGLPVDLDIASDSATANQFWRTMDLPCSSPSRARRWTPWRPCATARHTDRTSYPLSMSRKARSPGRSDAVLFTLAGAEIGVASTKAFTTQLAVLACLAIAAARARGRISPEREVELTTALREVPSRVLEILCHDQKVQDLAHGMVEAQSALFLGRGTTYPIALEGALKLKEISYIHAEGYAAGEMKHGPIALIDETVPVVCIAPSDALFDKVASNIQEAAARGGRVLLLSDAGGVERLRDKVRWTLQLPSVDPLIAPIVYAIPIRCWPTTRQCAKAPMLISHAIWPKSVTVE